MQRWHFYFLKVVGVFPLPTELDIMKYLYTCSDMNVFQSASLQDPCPKQKKKNKNGAALDGGLLFTC